MKQTKDKLILDTAEKHYSDSAECLDAFLHGVEFAESLSPWISVEEDLPFNHKELLYDTESSIFPCTKLVLIRTEENVHELSFMYIHGYRWDWDFKLDKITHWMPIPEI